MSGTPAQQSGVAPSPAQWALSRMLDAAFDDRETASRCMNQALTRAGRRTVPESIDEMLAFGREHLLPIMAEELGPRLVAALFEDLTAELMRRSDVHNTTQAPFNSSIPRLTVPPIISEVPRSSPTIQSPAPGEGVAPTRPVIAIVETDRWTRASIARVLVQGGYDVLPLDTPATLRELPYEINVLVIEVDDTELAALCTLFARRPNLRVVAWTKREPSEAGRRLHEAGITRNVVVARTASMAQLADAVRGLASN